ncbi:MAG: nucleotidyltransferase domain-containing protein, partial [Anaerolineae bacterium]
MDRQAIRQAREYHARREIRRRQSREQLRQEQYRRAYAAILILAPTFPTIRAVYLFGSLVQPGRFGPWSDLDVAILCDDVETESKFWRDLEAMLQRDVDLRPCAGSVAWAVATYGECIYEREVPDPGAQH